MDGLHRRIGVTIYETAIWRPTPVSNVLELDVFRRAGAFVAAGHAGLDRPVRWVHCGESTSIANFLTGGELLLTSGQGLGTAAKEQRDFVRSLADAGASALVVELGGRVFTDLPKVVIDEADKREIPLVGLPRKIPFVEAVAEVLQQLMESATQQLAGAYEISGFLTKRLLSGADAVTLVHDFARRIGRPVVLESVSHDIKAYRGDDHDDGLVRDWSSHSRSDVIHHAHAEPGTRCRKVAVVVQEQTWGWLHLPASGRADTNLDLLALDHAASAIAISLLSSRVTRARSAHRQGILLNRLVAGDLNGPGFVQRALQIGQDLRPGRLVVAEIASRTKSLQTVESEIGEALRVNDMPAIVADIGRAVVAVIGVPEEQDLAELPALLVDADRTIGLSKIVDGDGLLEAVGQARSAASTRRPIQMFDDLGLLRLLIPLADGPELDHYVEDELGPLLDHEVTKDSPLLDTLVVFLDCDGNKSEAATKLFLHRRSLYYRLEKIEKILGRSLDDAETRLRLRIAIRAQTVARNPRSPHDVAS